MEGVVSVIILYAVVSCGFSDSLRDGTMSYCFPQVQQHQNRSSCLEREREGRMCFTLMI